MSKHFLSVEQMQNLINRGVDCSNASHIWVDFDDQKNEWELLINSKGVDKYAYKSVPCFDIQDILNILPIYIKTEIGIKYFLTIDRKIKATEVIYSVSYGEIIIEEFSNLILSLYMVLIDVLGFKKDRKPRVWKI